MTSAQCSGAAVLTVAAALFQPEDDGSALLSRLDDALAARGIDAGNEARLSRRSPLEQALASREARLIHLYLAGMRLPDAEAVRLPGHLPVLATLGLPSLAAVESVRALRPAARLVTHARALQALWPADLRSRIEVVAPGVRLGAWKLPLGADRTLIVSAIHPRAGIETLLDAARRARTPATLASQRPIDDAGRHYFADRLAPCVRVEPIRGCDAAAFPVPRGILSQRTQMDRPVYAGVSDARQRRRLLSGARCLLLAVTADSPTLPGLEALAAGVPVVAWARDEIAAAVWTELLEERGTGAVVRDAFALPEAIQRASSLDAVTCRSVAERRFGLADQMEGYLDRFQSLAPDLFAGWRLRGRVA